MGLIKTDTTAVGNGIEAAIERLNTTAAQTAVVPAKQWKGRDFDKEARGKTRCVQFEAALQSPAIAGMKWKTMEEYLKLVLEAAEAGVKYTFDDSK